MKYPITSILFIYILTGFPSEIRAQQKIQEDLVKAAIHIDVNNGHVLEQGSSGFNVRIADKVWNYTHPDFKQAVYNLRPGWLRYFSGTTGDAFSAATGQYNLDYAMMMDKQDQYFRGHMFTEIKGPHRIIDLYHLLGEVGAKLVVTINGFTETPQMTAELARFCKNNHIEVEAWQFCNEPYFYVPSRDRYWWNDGYDYALKMKPHADAILSVFPDARLALNCTWDGIWGFMKEIHRYQEENGRYWNVFSKHSYAPHIGGRESFEDAFKRANTKVVQVTGEKAMEDIEDFSWEGAPLLITEFGVWNRPLNGIISAIYQAEYTLRQLQHPNAFLIGSHEISSKNRPAINKKHLIVEAFKKGMSINTDTIRTGVEITDDGNAMAIIHEATNHTTFTWDTYVTGAATVLGMRDESVEGVYARAFKGNCGFDYLAITNRSGRHHDFTVKFGDKLLERTFYRKYIWSATAENKDVPVIRDTVSGNHITVPPHCVMLVKWLSGEKNAPAPTRIFKAQVTGAGVMLHWWKRENATAYRVYYGERENKLNERIRVAGSNNNHYEIKKLKRGKTYYFNVVAENATGKSERSKTVSIPYKLPSNPEIFKTDRNDTTITVFWRSVPGAAGYFVKVRSGDTSYDKVFDAKNVFGYRVEGLKYDVPYHISIVAYNGLGEGPASFPKEVTCKRNLPVTPRNISARETADDNIYLEWVVQDSVAENVRYRVYRGKKPHHFSVLAENITGNTFIDTDPDNQERFYTVKAYTDEGASDFYPNIATVIERNKALTLTIENVVKKKDHFLVKIYHDNIVIDKGTSMGLTINDISYLNVEEETFRATEAETHYFFVKLPFSSLKQGSTYAIKAFIKRKANEINSLPPYMEINF